MGVKLAYCLSCKRVTTPRKFSWFAFIFGLLFLAIGAVIYVIYYFATGGKKCPMCGSKAFSYDPTLISEGLKTP